MSIVVYSAQETGFEPGFAYRNPRYFHVPLGRPDKVVVVGKWPNVVAAYEALGIEVEVVSPGTPLRVPGKIAPPSTPQSDAGGNLDNPKGEPVEIPADWASWHWSQQEKLALALVGGSGPLVPGEGQTRAQKAKAIIEAEVAERASHTSA